MSIYDSNKYHFSLQKYRSDLLVPPSYTPSEDPSSTALSLSDQLQLNEKSELFPTETDTMAADTTSYTLIPRLSTDSNDGRPNPDVDDCATLTGHPSSSPSSNKHVSVSIRALTTTLRLLSIILTAVGISLIACFYYSAHLTALVFLIFTLTKEVLVVFVHVTCSYFAFRIRFERKKNVSKSAVNTRPSEPQRTPKKRGRSWFIAHLDALAGLGLMIGALVIATHPYYSWPVCIIPFIVMALQWITALLSLCRKCTVLTLVVSHPVSPLAVLQSYRDLEQDVSPCPAGQAGDENAETAN